MNLKSLLLTSALLTCSGAAMAAEQAPKYIFYFIGDGMGPGAVMGTDTYLRLATDRTTPLLWETFPQASLQTTYSYSSPVTDSAAAGTALATGHKTRNNMLGMGPDSVAVGNVADSLLTMGYGIALLTNVAADDATPGAFYAHVPSRDDAYDIDCQAAESGVSFLAGSRIRGIKRNGKYSGIYEKFADNGWKVIRGVQNYDPSAPKVLLVNNQDTLSNNSGYAIDFPAERNLLRDYTKAAIQHMTTHSPERFFMMVESGNIDWAAHDNDAATIIRETLDFEETLGLAYDFYLAHPDETLIIVTADHETGGMSVGRKSVGYNCYPKLIEGQNISKAEFGELVDRMLKRQEPVTMEEMKQILTDRIGFYTLIPINEARQKRLDETFERTFITRNDYFNDALYHRFPEFVEEVFDILNETSGFGFTTTKHSGNPVGVYSIGPGSELLGAPMDNTDIPRLILKSAQR
ncbi:MAG: alkaline phosphatase [Muribaculaceae bacterium]|nr:alkaline phosphatase [Muribaculaceae bacterium]